MLHYPLHSASEQGLMVFSLMVFGVMVSTFLKTHVPRQIPHCLKHHLRPTAGSEASIVGGGGPLEGMIIKKTRADGLAQCFYEMSRIL